MANPFRTTEQIKKYEAFKAAGGLDAECALCIKKPIKQFSHWKITSNDFPYDLVAKTHHMLVSLRHVVEKELTDEEREEFAAIKADYLQQYNFIIEATERQRSIPQHLHLHLIVSKD